MSSPVATGGRWISLPQSDDDSEPPRAHARGPVIADGDEWTVRTTSGVECLATFGGRSGWHVSEDDPSYGTDAEPSCYTDHAIDVSAVFVPAPPPRRETRTEADMADRYDTIKLRLPRGHRRRLDALCESEGQSASKLVATWIDGAERELRALKAR